MKNSLLIIALLICGISLAQAPQKMSYQAIVRDADGNLISEQTVGVKISILKNSSTGEAVYEESHTPTTNVNGLFTLEIGTGTVLSGVFADINWGSDDFYIKSETDPTGGNTYSIAGVSQLLSVPYALHAKTAENVTAYKVGDSAHGGIVIWVDETGQHGLVCSTKNIANSTKWSAGTFGKTQAKGNGVGAGKLNTSIIISAHIFIGDDDAYYAARLCNELEVVANNVIYGDWYLPSVFEIKLMSLNVATINATATNIGGDTLLNDTYWSSIEDSSSAARIVNGTTGQESAVLKSSLNAVRAVRSF